MPFRGQLAYHYDRKGINEKLSALTSSGLKSDLVSPKGFSAKRCFYFHRLVLCAVEFVF